MSRKALKAVFEFHLTSVSCPGVHLAAKDDIYLSVFFLGQCCESEHVPPVFPLHFHQKMVFEKVFRQAVDPGDVAVLLENELVQVELVQLIPPGTEMLAFIEEDARSFFYPEPKLVPCFSGGDREFLMTRTLYFPGIAPRLEFSTQTTITDCPADAHISINYKRPVINRKRKHTNSRWVNSPRTRRAHISIVEGPQRNQVQTLCRPTSSFPRRFGDGPDGPRASWPARWSSVVRPLASAPHSTSSDGGSSSTDPRPPPDPEDFSGSLSASPVGGAERESASLDRSRSSRSSSCSRWDEIQQRVQRLLTAPRAVHRLVSGATDSEVDEVLARRFISSDLR